MSAALGCDTNMYIGNRPVAGLGARITVHNPASEEVIASFPTASVGQVAEAVAAARSAFENGAWASPELRKEILLRFAEGVESQRDRLMDLIIAENGTPMSLKANHIDTPCNFLRWFAEQGTRDLTRHLGFNGAATAVSTIAYRPVGVVAAISAFNYPLLIGLTKIGQALSVGCTAVLLSSPQAPLSIQALGEIARDAGFPEGVVSFLAGGAEVGEALTGHRDVAKVSFTGSVAVGKKVMKQAAENLSGVVLELGGKSAAILLPGVDHDRYAFQLHARYARNAGQGCGSPTRILVHEDEYDKFCAASRSAYEKITVGDPTDPATVLGPVISAEQRDRIEDIVARAVSDGAEIVAGGGRPNLSKGWFINPVLLGRVENSAWIARNEIFGPVSVVITYRTVEEAIAIANDSELGLKAYIFGDRAECQRIAPKLRVGTVQINGGSPLRADAPMNGSKLSGIGAEWGEDGLREFVTPQHIDVAVG